MLTSINSNGYCYNDINYDAQLCTSTSTNTVASAVALVSSISCVLQCFSLSAMSCTHGNSSTMIHPHSTANDSESCLQMHHHKFIFGLISIIRVLMSNSRREMDRRESVGGWRKDKFQWMSLALVGTPNAPITPHGMHFPSTPLPVPSPLFLLLSEIEHGGSMKMANWLTQVYLKGWLLNQHVCVCDSLALFYNDDDKSMEHKVKLYRRRHRSGAEAAGYQSTECSRRKQHRRQSVVSVVYSSTRWHAAVLRWVSGLTYEYPSALPRPRCGLQVEWWRTADNVVYTQVECASYVQTCGSVQPTCRHCDAAIAAFIHSVYLPVATITLGFCSFCQLTNW